MREGVDEPRLVVINNAITESAKDGLISTNDVSDGYHTFGELYEHRITLFIALCKSIEGQENDAWRSLRHSDGELAFGGTWFVLGIGKDKGKQITYHLPIEKWNETNFCETLSKAPEYDGHTPNDVLERLKNL